MDVDFTAGQVHIVNRVGPADVQTYTLAGTFVDRLELSDQISI